MAVPLAAFWGHSVPLAALSLAPLFLIFFTQRAVLRLEEAGEMIGRQNASLEEAHAQVIERSTAALEALSATVDARDTYTAGHSRRVAASRSDRRRELGLAGAELDRVGQAALLHDIGKIAVPDAVLLKEGPLSAAEWTVMRSHPEEGARIIERLGYLDEVVPGIRYHHERPDGRGYPDGVLGRQDPARRADHPRRRRARRDDDEASLPRRDELRGRDRGDPPRPRHGLLRAVRRRARAGGRQAGRIGRLTPVREVAAA